MRKVLTWVAVVFAVFFVTTNPAGAARAVKGAGNIALAIGNGVSSFFAAVTS